MDGRRRRFEAQALRHLDAAYNLARWLSRTTADAEDIVLDAADAANQIIVRNFSFSPTTFTVPTEPP